MSDPVEMVMSALADLKHQRTAFPGGPTEHGGVPRSQAKFVSSVAPGKAILPTAVVDTQAPNPAVESKNGAGDELPQALKTLRG